MLLNILVFLILGCNAVIVSSECPKSQLWRNMKISPGGPLVCARLYGDEKCSGFPLPFGINSSTSNLGTESSSAIDFVRNNVTALVRPGCNMFLWEDANFTGRLEKSTNYIWHVDRRHYSSAMCNCSDDDVELLQCELREKWEELNFCDFRESDIGGLCSVKLKRSYIEDGDGDMKNVTITKNLANLFTAKMIESFGVKRMASFLDVNSNDKLAHSIFVDAGIGFILEQRSYVCGKYQLFTPEVAKKYLRKDGFKEDPKLDKWIYNQNSETYFWLSSAEEGLSGAGGKCKEMGGHLARFYTAELRNWTQPLLVANTDGNWWIYRRHEGDCLFIHYSRESYTVIEWVWSQVKSLSTCELKFHYICEREHGP